VSPPLTSAPSAPPAESRSRMPPPPLSAPPATHRGQRRSVSPPLTSASLALPAALRSRMLPPLLSATTAPFHERSRRELPLPSSSIPAQPNKERRPKSTVPSSSPPVSPAINSLYATKPILDALLSSPSVQTHKNSDHDWSPPPLSQSAPTHETSLCDPPQQSHLPRANTTSRREPSRCSLSSPVRTSATRRREPSPQQSASVRNINFDHGDLLSLHDASSLHKLKAMVRPATAQESSGTDDSDRLSRLSTPSVSHAQSPSPSLSSSSGSHPEPKPPRYDDRLRQMLRERWANSLQEEAAAKETERHQLARQAADELLAATIREQREALQIHDITTHATTQAERDLVQYGWNRAQPDAALYLKNTWKDPYPPPPTVSGSRLITESAYASFQRAPQPSDLDALQDTVALDDLSGGVLQPTDPSHSFSYHLFHAIQDPLGVKFRKRLLSGPPIRPPPACSDSALADRTPLVHDPGINTPDTSLTECWRLELAYRDPAHDKDRLWITLSARLQGLLPLEHSPFLSHFSADGRRSSHRNSSHGILFLAFRKRSDAINALDEIGALAPSLPPINWTVRKSIPIWLQHVKRPCSAGTAPAARTGACFEHCDDQIEVHGAQSSVSTLHAPALTSSNPVMSRLRRTEATALLLHPRSLLESSIGSLTDSSDSASETHAWPVASCFNVPRHRFHQGPPEFSRYPLASSSPSQYPPVQSAPARPSRQMNPSLTTRLSSSLSNATSQRDFVNNTSSRQVYHAPLTSISSSKRSVVHITKLFDHLIIKESSSNAIKKSHLADNVASTSNQGLYEWFETELGKNFEFTSPSNLEYCLGVESLHFSDGKYLTYSQHKYADNLLKHFDFFDARPVTCPTDPKLSLAGSPPQVDLELQKEYRAKVGSLQWLALLTRPDLSNSVAILSHFVHAPGICHLEAANRVFQYVQGTANLGLTYVSDEALLPPLMPKLNQLVVFSDASFADCSDTAKSTTGDVLTLNGAAVIYGAKRQSTVMLCTSASETNALCKTTVAISQARLILSDLGARQDIPTPTHVDNKTALSLSEGKSVMSETQKHVTVQAKYVTECVHRGIITLVYVPTVQQRADIFTKPLGGQVFRLHQDVLMSVDPAKLSSSSALVVTAGVSPKLSLSAGALSSSSLSAGASHTSQLIKLLAQCRIKMSERNVLRWTLLRIKLFPPLRNQTSFWLDLLRKVDRQLDALQARLLGKSQLI